MKKQFITILILFSISFFAGAQDCNLEGYYLHQDTYPDDDDPFWFPNNTEVQGVANDGKDWYITITGHEDISGTSYWGGLWRIPKEEIGYSSTSNPNAVYIEMADIPEFNSPTNPFWHWGDPDHFEYDSDGDGTSENYILVPIYPKNNNGIIACFKSETSKPLEYINYANISLRPGWCAIDNDGNLFSSINHTTSLKKFEVDWELITNKDNNNHNLLSQIATINLTFKGNDYDELKHMQGGEFSTSGDLLYLVSGGAECLGFGSGEAEPSDGIHVFQSSNWTEIETSVKNGNGSDHFVYNFDNNCQGLGGSESPEGLTIWDLEDENNDGYRGSLHVLVFHWNLGNITGNNNHKASMHHFSNRIHLDHNADILLIGPFSGNKSFPFQNLDDANSYYPIWDGSEMILKAGNYNGDKNMNIIIDKKVKLTSSGGPVIIGE